MAQPTGITQVPAGLIAHELSSADAKGDASTLCLRLGIKSCEASCVESMEGARALIPTLPCAVLPPASKTALHVYSVQATCTYADMCNPQLHQPVRSAFLALPVSQVLLHIWFAMQGANGPKATAMANVVGVSTPMFAGDI